jgi:hypothetical protein
MTEIDRPFGKLHALALAALGCAALGVLTLRGFWMWAATVAAVAAGVWAAVLFWRDLGKRAR